MIPISKPNLPKFNELKKYIDLIDQSRVYTNNGPLINRFEDEISKRLNGLERCVISTSSGTAALQIALLAKQLPSKSIVILPAFTFIATVQAVLLNDLIPYFVDVSLETWAITPKHVQQALQDCGSRAKAAIVVAPFGSPINVKSWEAFSSENNVEILIDAAGVNFELITPSYHVPVIISTHATKLLTTGEGGFVVSKNQEFLSEISAIRNFGLKDRGILFKAGNSKLSEYHAAIGLATLDRWEQKRCQLITRTRRYRDNLRHLKGIKFLEGYGENWMNVNCVIDSHPSLSSHLNLKNIETRKWWRSGCHNEPILNRPRLNLKNTDILVERYLGIPMFEDISLEDIDAVCEVICINEKYNHPI